MRILVMGSGGLGGCYGGLLAQHGHDVTFVARGPHLAALRERGLELRRAVARRRSSSQASKRRRAAKIEWYWGNAARTG